MKYICLSFDDARSDTYEVTLPIMNKYSLAGTVNIISDFVMNPEKYHFVSSPRSMTKEQVLEWQRNGGEVACHGSTHKNMPEDIFKNIEELELMGVNIHKLGFASPESWLTEENLQSSGIGDLKKNKVLYYLRSGINVRREGMFYTILAGIEMVTHSSLLFYILNKKNIFSKGSQITIFPSVAIKDYTTVKQVQYIIDKMKDNDVLILMFHSVLKMDDKLYGADHWFWDAEQFESLCKWLKSQNMLKVLLTRDVVI